MCEFCEACESCVECNASNKRKMIKCKVFNKARALSVFCRACRALEWGLCKKAGFAFAGGVAEHV